MSLGSSLALNTDQTGAILLAAENLSLDGDLSFTGEGGLIYLFGNSVEVNKAISVTADTAGSVLLSGSNVLINDAINVAGAGSAVGISVCNCVGSQGQLIINGDVVIDGVDGIIDISSDRNLWLNANIVAEVVFMEAEGDISSTEQSVVKAQYLDARSAGGAIVLDRSQHQVDMMQASAHNGLRFANASDLAVGQALVTGNGNIAIRSAGNLSLDEAYDPVGGTPLPHTGTIRIEGVGDIDLAAGTAFINTLGNDVLQANQGNWRVWSAAPGADTLGGLAYQFKQYNAHYGASTVQGQGNGVLYALAPTLDVGLQGSVVKTYDGTDGAAVTDANYVVRGGVVHGDHVAVGGGQGRYSDANAAQVKTVLVDGMNVVDAYELHGGAKVYGYQIKGTPSGDIGRIDRRAITVAANDQLKLLGRPDPALTWRIVEGSLVLDDVMGGTLVRDAGELQGSYAIRQGSLSAGANYAMTFIDGRLVIQMGTIDDALGDLADAYGAAVFSAQNAQQGPAPFDQDHGQDIPTTYQIENGGLRMPEGI